MASSWNRRPDQGPGGSSIRGASGLADRGDAGPQRLAHLLEHLLADLLLPDLGGDACSSGPAVSLEAGRAALPSCRTRRSSASSLVKRAAQTSWICLSSSGRLAAARGGGVGQLVDQQVWTGRDGCAPGDPWSARATPVRDVRDRRRRGWLRSPPWRPPGGRPCSPRQKASRASEAEDEAAAAGTKRANGSSGSRRVSHGARGERWAGSSRARA